MASNADAAPSPPPHAAAPAADVINDAILPPRDGEATAATPTQLFDADYDANGGVRLATIQPPGSPDHAASTAKRIASPSKSLSVHRVRKHSRVSSSPRRAAVVSVAATIARALNQDADNDDPPPLRRCADPSPASVVAAFPSVPVATPGSKY
ncbi:hypothetical protein ACHAWF_017479, partial [Thalassiosira exigua]